MLKQIVDMGIISAIFYYTVGDDTAYIHELRLGGAEAVSYTHLTLPTICSV